jgi:hypothetical protein
MKDKEPANISRREFLYFAGFFGAATLATAISTYLKQDQSETLPKPDRWSSTTDIELTIDSILKEPDTYLYKRITTTGYLSHTDTKTRTVGGAVFDVNSKKVSPGFVVRNVYLFDLRTEPDENSLKIGMEYVDESGVGVGADNVMPSIGGMPLGFSFDGIKINEEQVVVQGVIRKRDDRYYLDASSIKLAESEQLP